MINNKRLMIFGGSGSLGKKLIDIYGLNNDIYIYSRDENKHWEMSQCNQKLNFIIGDIRDQIRVEESIKLVNPHIIIIASALKHIDRCEYEVNECFQTNTFGVQNVLKHSTNSNLECVVFISTDKACSPVNTYGLSKATAEKMMISIKNKFPKFVTVRYGNVINSRGSIIQTLNNCKFDYYNLTDPKMTRFIMTQYESVELIDYAINHAKSGDIVIPKIRSINILDLIELFANKYSKTINITGLRPGEKLYEVLINETEFRRTIDCGKYLIIKPPYQQTIESSIEPPIDQVYSSNTNLLSKHELENYLIANDLF